jgi:DNA-3-methyladenine glycosylase II
MKTPHYWEQAAYELTERDAVLRTLIPQFHALPVRSRGDAFCTLARSIVGQQISVKAAQSVWDRLAVELKTISPNALLLAGSERLRACGLSTQKTAYLQDLAARFDSGTLNPRRWSKLGDDVLIDELTQVKGIGRWTAEMFLIFYMARPDVLPLDDLGLQRAMSRQYNKGRPVTRARMAKIGAVWAPWRSVATWYMWRSLDPVPVLY